MQNLSDLIPAYRDGELVAVEKLEAHRLGLLHLAISVFVVAEGKILMQQRAACKYHTPLLWTNTVCTHPHWGESDLDCATRRLKEELGIEGLTPELRHRTIYRADVGQGLTEHEDVAIFIAKAPSTGLAFTPNPDEVAAAEWMSLAQIEAALAEDPARFTPWLKIYLTEHRTAIFGE